MMKKNDPYFPGTGYRDNDGKLVDIMSGADIIQLYGPTVFEHLAHTAPNVVPDWFVHVEPPKNITPKPDWQTAAKKDHELLQAWLDDTETKLPEHLIWFPIEWSKHDDDKAAWDFANKTARYFQWRTYYSEQMINHINNYKPETDE